MAVAIEGRSIDEVFRDAVGRWPEHDLVVAPAIDGAPVRSLTYGQMAGLVEAHAAALRAAGYGAGQRAAVLLGATPEHYVIKLALNRLGMSCVPVNPDYRPAELAYLLEDSDAVLAIADERFEALMRAGISEAKSNPEFVLYDNILSGIPDAPHEPDDVPIGPATEASLLYTSGTTGRPKGCILSHEYELMVGQTYQNLGPPVALREGADRVLNPLPAFHINSGILTFFGVMQTGNTLIQMERFSGATWWRDIQQTGATVFHYLGVVISVLLADRDVGPEVLGNLRAGLGAGVEPSLHVEFERRFGIPLIEAWGMTEMCRVVSMWEEPRRIDTRAMGRAFDGLDVRIVGEDGAELPRNTPGEMVIRHSQATPRKGFFSGYLNKPEATAEAWAGGWFHTGDTVIMDEEGVLFFVDRSKNIIRRSGENIAAAEVENVLFEDTRVINVACIAAPDEIREEEVMACIVLAPDVAATAETARAIFDRAFEKMAYFKPPGWILFIKELPVTGTQKVVKHQIFPNDMDPRDSAGIHDFRKLKKRG